MIRRALLPLLVMLGGSPQLSGAAAQSSMGVLPVPVDSHPATPAGAVSPAVSDLERSAPPERADPARVFGVSRALKAAVLRSGVPVEPPLVAEIEPGEEAPQWLPLHGTVRKGLPGKPVYRGQVIAPDNAGVWRLDPGDGSAADSLTFITAVPFSEKRDEHLNGYHIGVYPTERSPGSELYAPPEAFIEVTEENQDVQVSEHFRLRQFLTKDQFEVWPKYLALNLRLVDKLELVIQELNAMGVRALGVHVMSGFRTPQYNGPGGDGRATLSRHMYGDAADIWVDGDHDGYIDDLNGDGRHDIRDAEVLLRAVERVEQKYPELTGGAGLYEANDQHGPYVHVDVRGTRARW